MIMSAEEAMARSLGLFDEARRVVVQSPDRRNTQQLNQHAKSVQQVSQLQITRAMNKFSNVIFLYSALKFVSAACHHKKTSMKQSTLSPIVHKFLTWESSPTLINLMGKKQLH